MPLSLKHVRAAAGTGLFAVTLAFPAAAGAQVTSGSAEVADTTIVRTTTTVGDGSNVGNQVVTAASPKVETEVLGETVSNNNLAVTGSDIAGLAVIGAVAFGAGTVLLNARRRRTQ